MRKNRKAGRMLKCLVAIGLLAAPAISQAQITVTSTFDGGSSSSDLQTPNQNFSVLVTASGFTNEAPSAYDFRINYDAADIRLVSIDDLTPYFPDMEVFVTPEPSSMIPDWDSTAGEWFSHASGAALDGSLLPSAGSTAASYTLHRLNFTTTASPAGPVPLEIVKNDRSPRPINPGVLTGAGDNPTAYDDPTFVNSAFSGLMGAADRDGEGVIDALEPSHTPAAGVTSLILRDSDRDGLSDEEELNYDTTFANFKNFTYDAASEPNPRNFDTDGDGFFDGLEARFPATFVNGPLVADSLTDADGDGLPASLDPNDGSIDTDNDGFLDSYEAAVIDLAAANNAGVFPTLGDADGNGSVNATDGFLAARLGVDAGQLSNPTITNFSGMDVDGNGSVNATDGFLMARRGVGAVVIPSAP